jgi:hypothetical protein
MKTSNLTRYVTAMFYVVRYNTGQFSENLSTFQKNMLSPSSRMKEE